MNSHELLFDEIATGTKETTTTTPRWTNDKKYHREVVKERGIIAISPVGTSNETHTIQTPTMSCYHPLKRDYIIPQPDSYQLASS
jgi:hypothetical protein